MKKRTAVEIMRDRGCTALEAEATLARESAEDGETTISVNGGPEVPVSVAMAALDAIRGTEAFPKPPAKPATETRQLMCRLTPDEQRARGVALADSEATLRELDEEKRELGARIKGETAKRDRLAENVKHCQEERPVTCLLTPDYEADSMTVTRTDNGEVVAVRQLTHGERQPDLPGTGTGTGEG